MRPKDLETCGKIESAGHVLKLTEDGEIDMWQLDYAYHNGPRCERCGTVWCIHCERSNNEEVEPCKP